MVMAYPGCYEYSDILAAACAPAKVGAARSHPLDFLFALFQRHPHTTIERVAAALHQDAYMYRAACHAYESVTGIRPPSTPPTEQQIMAVVERLSQNEDALTELRDRRVKVGVDGARAHGNLLPGQPRTWTMVDERHRIFGDGVILKRFSDATTIADPDDPDRLLLIGSRATSLDRARIQDRSRESGADNKPQAGITFIALYTDTPNGVVTLSVDAAYGGEALVLLPMVEAVAAEAGDGVHILTYDRVVQPGWTEDYLMAALGIQTLRKAVARPVPANEPSAYQWVEQQVAAEAFRPGTKALTRPELSVLVNRRAKELLDTGHLPPGVSIYPRRSGFDIVDSKFWYITEPHLGVGAPHDDLLVLDDEALYMLDDRGNKGALCRAVSAERLLTEQGTWARLTRWVIPCDRGEWTLERLWAPAAAYGPHERSSEERLVAHMSPIPRADPRFVAYNKRNFAESLNQAVEITTQHHGRAGHLHAGMQFLDFFSATQTFDARTWQHHPDAYHPWVHLKVGPRDFRELE